MTLMSLSLSGCGGGNGNSSEEDISTSSDASLTDLALTGATLDQRFQPSQTAYSTSVGFLQTSVTLTPVANHAGATIQLNGAQVASGTVSAAITLTEGQNTISLVVTAEDGVTTQRYSIEILREDAGLFAQQAYIKASNADGGYNLLTDYAGDHLGSSVAISGDTLVTGAPGESSSANSGEGDNSTTNAGAVYVFTRSGGVWSQQAYLKASNADEEDLFGTSVAISGDTLVVGAIGEDSGVSAGEEDNSTNDAGAAYVFTRSDGVWNQQAFLKASNANWADEFGASVAISGDTLVVGAPREDSSANTWELNNSATAAGAAYVFTRSGGTWYQQAFLKASNAETDDSFATSVAISGDTLVVGAPFEDSNASGGEDDNSASNSGATYVFTRSDGIWNQQAYLKASSATDEHSNVFGAGFGQCVAISGDTLAVGFPAGRSTVGEAYVFTRNGGVWSQQAILVISNGLLYSGFGTSIAISGDTLVVGSDVEAAYVFSRSRGIWTQQAQLMVNDAERGSFATSVAISGDTLAVSAEHADNSAGAIYIWQ